MPIYHARGVRIKLAAPDLDATITPAATLTRRKGTQAASNADKAEKTLRDQQSFLAETSVPLAEDEHGHSVNFMPDTLTPFLQVQVSLDSVVSTQTTQQPSAHISHQGSHAASSLQSLETPVGIQNEDQSAVVASSSKSNQHTYHSDQMGPFSGRPTFPEPSLRTARREVTAAVPVLKAVALHIFLSDLAYLPNSTGQPQSLKLEVFFNGMLVQSVLMLRSDVRSHIKSNHQCFAGTRVSQLAERPWVIRPPDSNPDGSRQTSNIMASAEDRWLEISAALFHDAEMRGKDRHGKAPPSATYLDQLAKMAMPAGVDQLQELGGRQFGVIDVVITAGSGSKAGGRTHAQYLHEPLRLIDERFKVRKAEGDESDEGNTNEEEREQALEAAETETDSDRDAEGVTDSEVEDGDDVPRPQAAPTPSSTLQGTGLMANTTSMMNLRIGVGPQAYPEPSSSFQGTGSMANPPSMMSLQTRSDPQMYPGPSSSSFQGTGFVANTPLMMNLQTRSDPQMYPGPSSSSFQGTGFVANTPLMMNLPTRVGPQMHPRPSSSFQGTGFMANTPSRMNLQARTGPQAHPRPSPSFQGTNFTANAPAMNLQTRAGPQMHPRPSSSFQDSRSMANIPWMNLQPRTGPQAYPESSSSFQGTGSVRNSPSMNFQLSGGPQMHSEQSSSRQGAGFMANAPSMGLRTRASPRVTATPMYPMAAAGPSNAPDPISNSGLQPDSDASQHQPAQYQGPIFPAMDFHDPLQALASSPALGFGHVNSPSDAQVGSSQYGSGSGLHNMSFHDSDLSLLTSPTLPSFTDPNQPPFTGPNQSPFTAVPPPTGNSSQGWSPQQGSASIGPPLGLTFRPGLPFAGGHQVDYTDQGQMLYIPPPGPPPAIGHFSVTRPQSSWTVNPDLPRPSICVSRLVITVALDVIVDYRWQVPQLVRTGRRQESMGDSELDQGNEAEFIDLVDSSEDGVSVPSKLKGKAKAGQTETSRLKMATGTKRRFDPRINLCASNPELNRNSVITYAEGDMGPLRQIRSERQGWFKESEVVVGMRFFVPGC